MTPERIMQMAFAFAPPLLIESAVRNGVFDALRDGSRTIPEIARTTGASVRGLTAAMDALVGLELLQKDDQSRYALAPESAAFLVKGEPGYRGDIFRHISTQLLPAWLSLADIVRTGHPARSVNQETTGSAFFQEFVESLFPMNIGPARALAEHLRVADADRPVRVLDLAAGSGVWSIALAERSPLVEVTAVDWPGVLPVTRRVVERHGLSARYRFVEGDLLTADFGIGYQVALLGHILHSEGEARSRALLARVSAALAPGGTAAIAEFLVDADRRGPVHGLMFAVNMLVHTEEGSTYSVEQLTDWLRETGLTDVRTIDAPSPSPLVVARKPG